MRSTLSLIDRILLSGSLKLDGDLLLRLINLEVPAKGLIPVHDYLHAQLTVGHSGIAGLAVRISLELLPAFALLPILVHRVQHHRRIAHRLPAIILENYQSED